MAKTWFQHDMNASAKEGLSNLLAQKNGCDLYGKFWLLQEHFYFSQMNSERFKNTIRINESTMVKVLKTNRRRLGTVLETFRNILGIVSETIREPFGTVYETTIPKALIYITKRTQKDADKIIELDIDKEKNKSKREIKYNPLNDCPFFNDSEFKEAWNSWNETRRKKKCSFSDRAIKKAMKKLMTLCKDKKETAIKILDKSADCGWSDLYPLEGTISEWVPPEMRNK